MICAKCPRSALGLVDGVPHCEGCVCWKDVLQRHRDSKPVDAKGWPK